MSPVQGRQDSHTLSLLPSTICPWARSRVSMLGQSDMCLPHQKPLAVESLPSRLAADTIATWLWSINGRSLHLTSVSCEQPIMLSSQECISFICIFLTCKVFSVLSFYLISYDWSMAYTSSAYTKGYLPEALNDICALQSLMLKAKHNFFIFYFFKFEKHCIAHHGTTCNHSSTTVPAELTGKQQKCGYAKEEVYNRVACMLQTTVFFNFIFNKWYFKTEFLSAFKNITSNRLRD